MKQSAFNLETEVSEHVRTQFYIGGEWVSSHSSRKTTVVSPDTEGVLLAAPLADTIDVDRAVAAARQAFDHGPWPKMSPPERAALIRNLLAQLNQRLPLFSRLWTAQVGVPVTFANMFVGFGSAVFNYNAGLAESFAFEDTRPTQYGKAQVIREPIGVAALIVPWNATLPLLSFKLAPALAAGCTVVIKSSPETPLDALLLAECAEAAGFPAGVINVITADRVEGEHLVSSPDVDKVSFTGSVAAGKTIAKTCIDRMARFTLELGGKSAAILLDDVDLATALPALAPFTMPFSGQICFAQTRLLAPRKRLQEITDAYAGVMSSLVVGDPWDDGTHLGPLAGTRQLDRTLHYIATGKAEGARLVTGGERSPNFNTGYYVQPTVFADVTPDMAIAREEIFGPVVVIQPYDDDDDAVAVANHSDMGLSGSVFTSDPERGYQVARRVKTGSITVNGLDLAPNVPFGGYKQSGMGREGGPEGLEAFLETKAVYRIGA